MNITLTSKAALGSEVPIPNLPALRVMFKSPYRNTPSGRRRVGRFRRRSGSVEEVEVGILSLPFTELRQHEDLLPKLGYHLTTRCPDVCDPVPSI